MGYFMIKLEDPLLTRKRHIACVGAALSIVSLAFGLFSQQLIGLRVLLVVNESPESAAGPFPTIRSPRPHDECKVQSIPKHNAARRYNGSTLIPTRSDSCHGETCYL